MMNHKREQQVEQEVERRLKEIQALREIASAQGLTFSSLTKEQLLAKVSGATGNTPYIYSQGWTSRINRGSSATYQVWATNPDPSSYSPVYVTMFFGLANFADDIAAALGGRDGAWPYISSPPTYLGMGANMSATLTYPTPGGAPLGTYLGNAVLWLGNYHDKGRYFDRGHFNVELF